MKIIITFSLLIIALSIGYYFVVFLPNEAVKQRQLEEWKIKISEQTNPVKLLDKCLADASTQYADFVVNLCKETKGCIGANSGMQLGKMANDPTFDASGKNFEDNKNECYKKYKK